METAAAVPKDCGCAYVFIKMFSNQTNLLIRLSLKTPSSWSPFNVIPKTHYFELTACLFYPFLKATRTP